MLRIKTILHPTDFSERSKSALQLACSLARDHDAKLVIVHVVLPPTMVYGDVVPAAADDSYEQDMKKALETMEVPALKQPVERVLAEGDAANKILETAQEQQADLIVMGTHGRTGLSRLLMGSVAEQVVRKALCPVLTLKAPVDQADVDEQTTEETTS